MARLAAGVRIRKNGQLEKRFTINGKRYSVYASNSKELALKEQQMREDIKNGLYTENRNLTLDQFYQEFRQIKKSSCKPNSLYKYDCLYKAHISPVFGKRRIQQIERRELIQFRENLKDTLTDNTKNQVLGTLKIILAEALRLEIIQKNPAAGIREIKYDKKRAATTIHRALTEEEQKQFMLRLKEVAEGSDYYEFIALMLCTGMRVGEVAALTWGDIDYKTNNIHVSKTTTLSETGTITIGTPKSEAGRRDIPITETAKRILAKQRNKIPGIIPTGETSIFSSLEECVIRSTSVNVIIHRVLESLNADGIHIEEFSSHAFRDTFATRAIEQGMEPQTLKTILGHSSLVMTMDLYAHVLPNTKQKEMQKVAIII